MRVGAGNRVVELAANGVLDELWAELLASEGKGWGRAVSDSMYPTIRAGDRILVEAVPPERVRFGDIVIFRRGKTLVVHRILGRRTVAGRVFFVEKGDANLTGNLVMAEHLVGRVHTIGRASLTVGVVSGAGRLVQCMLGMQSRVTMWLWIGMQQVVRGDRHQDALVPLCRRVFGFPPSLINRLVGL